MDVTLFCWRAVARCCAPCGPIRLSDSCSMVSVYETKRMKDETKRQGYYIVLFQSIGKMLCSFVIDQIADKVEFGECLCETKTIRDSMKRQECYIVLFKSIGKMLCSLWTDPIVFKGECGECLCETKRMRDGMKSMDVTLFCWRAVARCCAPCGPIRLQSMFSMVSVYVKQKE